MCRRIEFLSCRCAVGSLMFLVMLMLHPWTTNAQQRDCGTDHYYKDHQGYVPPNVLQPQLEPRASYTLPVVIHVVWQQSGDNISDQQIYRQLERLNLDFNNPNLDRRNVPDEFRKFIGNPQIRFCLASKDPKGNKYSGINRIKTTIDKIGSKKDGSGRYMIHYSSLGGQDAWDPDRYINIWVGQMETIFGRSSIGGRVPVRAEDGLVIDSDFFKADPAINYTGRTLVHEMGHYLGLLHLWGSQIGDCIEDDGIPDTPFQEGPYYDCPSFPQSSCTASSMFMNFMDYVDDDCMQLFTRDQIKVMSSTLSSSRKGLTQSTDLCAIRVEPIQLSALEVFLHRPSGRITIRSGSYTEDNLYVFVFNALGQKLIEKIVLLDTPKELYTKDWPSGIYFLYFRYTNQSRTIKLLIS